MSSRLESPESAPDDAVEEVQRAQASKVLTLMNNIEKWIDDTACHIVDSALVGVKASCRHLFHGKQKKKNDSASNPPHAA